MVMSAGHSVIFHRNHGTQAIVFIYLFIWPSNPPCKYRSSGKQRLGLSLIMRVGLRQKPIRGVRSNRRVNIFPISFVLPLLAFYLYLRLIGRPLLTMDRFISCNLRLSPIVNSLSTFYFGFDCEACVRTGFGKGNVQKKYVGEVYWNCGCGPKDLEFMNRSPQVYCRYIYLVIRSNFTLATPSIHHISKATTNSISPMQYILWHISRLSIHLLYLE
jgi:hypothetical protein